MKAMSPRCSSYANSWQSFPRLFPIDVVRGEIYHLRAPRSARGNEQAGARYAIVVQADEFLGLSTTLIAPTSTRALPATFRPMIELDGRSTRVLVEQTTVVDPQRLGRSVGRLDSAELEAVDDALARILDLRL